MITDAAEFYRLANLDHNLKVLLIEAGESNLNNPWVYRPGIYPRNMKLDSKTASFYESRPSKWLAGRKAVVPCAHILGGGSSINFMMYTRASASDYDDFQAEGWTTKDLLPLMRKHETYQRAGHNRDVHGYEGPIKVSFGNYTYPIKDDFLRAAESQGIPVVDDLQDLATGHGAEHWLKWINRDTGRRSDSAHAYVHSTRAVHSNLYLACNTKVDRVIIEGGRAVGVRTVPTKPFPGQDPQGRTFRARRQVVVSGGTLSSPLILQRSGIGDTKKLEAVGVKPVVDLPGVGLNFQDHYLTFSVFRAKPDTESFDDFVRGDPEVQRSKSVRFIPSSLQSQNGNYLDNPSIYITDNLPVTRDRQEYTTSGTSRAQGRSPPTGSRLASRSGPRRTSSGSLNPGRPPTSRTAGGRTFQTSRTSP